MRLTLVYLDAPKAQLGISLHWNFVLSSLFCAAFLCLLGSTLFIALCCTLPVPAPRISLTLL